MAFMALRSRRILPTISTLVNNHFAVSSFARLPEPPLNSTTSPVVQFQSRLFRSSPISMLCSTSPVNEEKVEEKINPNDIIFAGCDYNHWLITIDFPKDPKPTAEEMVETYVQTCAKGLNISEEEAKKRIYACSTTTYKGFQAVMTEEESEQFRALPNVIFILPDSYIDHVKKEYGGDKYLNGTIIPRPLPPQQNRFQGQTDRNMGRGRDDRSYRPPRSYAQQNRGNYPPQGGMHNSRSDAPARGSERTTEDKKQLAATSAAISDPKQKTNNELKNYTQLQPNQSPGTRQCPQTHDSAVKSPAAKPKRHNHQSDQQRHHRHRPNHPSKHNRPHHIHQTTVSIHPLPQNSNTKLQLQHPCQALQQPLPDPQIHEEKAKLSPRGQLEGEDKWRKRGNKNRCGETDKEGGGEKERGDRGKVNQAVDGWQRREIKS
ncbi:unnamed protein product [Rhodiola kirilowii]